MPGLYLHIPYCEKKCIYCDFYSIESTSSIENFLRCLNLEIDSYSTFGRSGETFETIYFGGGTPSLLPPRTIDALLLRLAKNFQLAPGVEITLETNPGTVDSAKLKDFRSVGINRLSIGIQSFHDSELRFLSRIHSAEEAKECIRLAHEAGFDNVSLDLIFALPAQTLQAWQENLSTAVKLSPEHISAYSLIIEEGTPLAKMVERREVVPVSEDLESEMYAFTMDYLASTGYEHYEVSNYAKPGLRSKHNSLYWNHESYLGFGPSAHSFWRGAPLEMPARWWNIASIGWYCDKIARGGRPIGGEEELDKSNLLMEEIFLGLRSDGINLSKLHNEYGISLVDRYPDKLGTYLEEGFVEVDQDTIRLTPKGFLLCDGIALDLVA